MDIRITEILPEQKELFLNLYNLYLYDLSAFTGEDPAEDGRFDTSNNALYLERNELFPYFIYCSGKVAGFVLVCSPPFVPDEVDYAVQELFLLKKYRGRQIAQTAVAEVMGRLTGRVRVEQLKNNAAAAAFWRSFYKQHSIVYTETSESVEIEGLPGVHEMLAQTFALSPNFLK
ncbi:MAG: GNAT family N-acetyltransferase [Paenibacillus macerans]|uniref:GNAT family N-acetyltransferase n=1 Tax=Paenibacillus TaxID=44249 RepID=UPI00290688CA|nr:GNAT family N-acetyltransferase [Paenibacillus macerans]MDU7473574.1 GNAT family N-acetyltransferase [Paenibacillus macerans]MEC0328263.1 GNAT family N-acetyltransferase [Paenibacillus macerans]